MTRHTVPQRNIVHSEAPARLALFSVIVLALALTTTGCAWQSSTWLTPSFDPATGEPTFQGPARFRIVLERTATESEVNRLEAIVRRHHGVTGLKYIPAPQVMAGRCGTVNDASGDSIDESACARVEFQVASGKDASDIEKKVSGFDPTPGVLSVGYSTGPENGVSVVIN